MHLIKLSKLGEDSDGMVQLELHASNGHHMSTEDFYIYPEDVIQFGLELQTFPQNIQHVVSLESGSDDPKFYKYILVRALVWDSIGHTALEIKTDNHSAPPHHATAHFFIICEAAWLNDFGKELCVWAKNMSDPLIKK